MSTYIKSTVDNSQSNYPNNSNINVNALGDTELIIFSDEFDLQISEDQIITKGNPTTISKNDFPDGITVLTIPTSVPVISFVQPTNMIFGESPQNLAVSSTDSISEITLTSSDTSIATVSKVSDVWFLSVLSSGSVQITASQSSATPVVRTITIADQFDDLIFNGFTVNPTIESGRLIVNEGSTNFQRYINFPNITNDTDVEFSCEFEVLGAIDASTYGIGIGKRTVNPWYGVSLVGHMDLNTTNKGLRLWQLSAGTADIFVVDKTGLTEIGDMCKVTYKQVGNAITVIGENLTKSFVWSESRTNSLSSTKDFVIPNASLLSVWSLGGSYAITKINRISNRVPNAKITFLGDSKTFGYSSADFTLSFASLIKAEYDGSANNFGGDGDRTVEMIQTIDNSLQGVGVGQNVALCIGRNDLSSGVPTETWQNNYIAISDKIKATGANLIHIANIPEDADFSALTAFIYATFPDDNIINPAIGWNNGTMLSADSIHPNVTGHSKVFNDILTSGFII